MNKIEIKPMPVGLDVLISKLDANRTVIIQAHDFPDHDAVASAFGLQYLLLMRGITSRLCFSGRIQSNSLTEAIKILHIPIDHSSKIHMDDKAQIIIVDGFVGNRNVSDLPGEVVGLIDHHSPPNQPTTAYYDIRTEYGSCSSVIYDYYKVENIEIPRDHATALLMGLMMDTAFMTRGVHPPDLEAFSALFFNGNWETGSRLLKNSLSLYDLATFKEAMNHCQIASDFCFIPLSRTCSPEVSALTADFFLNIQEIKFVVVLVPDVDEYRFSVRSEDPSRPSDSVIREAIKGIGSGGGHVHMGGGSIPLELFPGELTLRQRFIDALDKIRFED